MFSKFLATLLTLILTLSACANTSIPTSSIQHLSDLHDNGDVHDFCTTWATKLGGLTKWVTAAHCVPLHEDGSIRTDIKFMIGGKPATLDRVDMDLDLALFTGKADKGFAVALMEPAVGEKIKTFGFFIPDGAYTEGMIAGKVEGNQVYNLTSGPGSSGAPVLNGDNMVVGMTQFILCQIKTVCPATGGSTVKDIRKFLYGE